MCTLASGPEAFLWDTSQPLPGEERSTLGGAWWEQFYGGTSRSGQLSPTALQELAKASADLLTLLPDPTNWNRPALFKGVVVGAVQSGKTLSMMGLAAAAFDAGYKLVVVLGGVRDDLRTQTAKRFNANLLLQSDPIPGRKGATTLGGSTGPKGNARGFAPPYYVDCHNYGPLLPKLISSLERGAPCVVVIKKHPASLNDLASVLTEVYNTLGSRTVPTLLLDDECDEATVPGSEDDLAVPSGILGLWSNAEAQPHVAYVGYTATAAANLLQHPNWALYPHWVYLLRYAGPKDALWQFPEPSSDRWYTGPECYFGDFGDTPGEGSNFLISATVTDSELAGRVADNASLAEALRAYFVTGAYRLALDGKASFEDPEHFPAPHAMLVHTSVAQEDHARWAAGLQAEFGSVKHPDGSTGFDVRILSTKLRADEALWRTWYERLTASRERIYNERAHEETQGFLGWDVVRAKLPAVFQHVRLKVVNSDDGSSSLDFSQPRDASGRKLAPQDCFVVAIGGSRFSRGLTIDGLCVTYFARSATMRHDDVVMQMNRWFGYRGPYIEFCRVFTTMQGFTSLCEVSESDLALRGQLALLMQKKMAPADATIVFHASPYSRPTAKIGAGVLHDLTFSPFTRVLSYVELGALQEINQGWAAGALAEVRARGGILVTRSNNMPRGYLSRGWTALEVANYLDRWRFSEHNPPAMAGLMQADYRLPDPTQRQCRLLLPHEDPYQIAAYLRAWHRRGDAPAFNVGFAFGELDDDAEPFDVPLLNRVIDSDAVAIGGWTGRSENWRGDWAFDGVAPELIQSPNLRLQGADGLLLFYVIHKDAIGRSKQGRQRPCHTPFVGLAVPIGGPAFVRVLSSDPNA